MRATFLMRLAFSAFFGLLLLCAAPWGNRANANEYQGVTGFSLKRGVFISGDVGAFTAIGGYREAAQQGERTARSFSRIQPFVGISVGYDIFDFLAIALKLGQGYVADAARLKEDSESPNDFALSFADVALIGSADLHDRIRFSGSIFGGLAMMTPPVAKGFFNYGAHVGANVGIRYHTLLSGMVIGLDLNGSIAFLPQTAFGAIPGIVSLSLTPVISYVF